MKQPVRLKKPAQVRAEFQRKGLSIAQWARDHRLAPNLVYEILAGSAKRRCLRGQSHRAAVLLGLKQGELPTDSGAGAA